VVRIDDRTTAWALEVLQGSCDMERTSPSECTLAIRGGNDQHSARDGIGMDGEWYHQRVCEGTSSCGQIRARKFLLESLHSNLLITVSLV